MKRTLFLVLWVIFGYGPQAQGAIEIYANGHRYDSLQGYLSSKKSDTALHKLYVLSVEKGVIGALQDFSSTPVGHSITPEQLQGAIQQAVTRSKDPKLLLSRPGKVRIMSLTIGDADCIISSSKR